jgi:hypothetical protein
MDTRHIEVEAVEINSIEEGEEIQIIEGEVDEDGEDLILITKCQILTTTVVEAISIKEATEEANLKIGTKIKTAKVLCSNTDMASIRVLNIKSKLIKTIHKIRFNLFHNSSNHIISIKSLSTTVKTKIRAFNKNHLIIINTLKLLHKTIALLNFNRGTILRINIMLKTKRSNWQGRPLNMFKFQIKFIMTIRLSAHKCILHL